MIPQPQVTSKRTIKELFQEFISRAHIYLPEWNPGREQDSGAALVWIFLQMFDQVRMRLNRMPEKSLIAFMDALGIDLLPAQSAKAWIAFTAVPEAPSNAIVPIGSALSGKGKDASGKDADVVFQTLKDVAVSPSIIKEIVSIRSASDDIYISPYDSKNSGLIEPFSGDNKQEHSVYIAHPHLFNISQKAILSFNFLLSAGAQRDMTDEPEKDWYIWEYFNATYGNWVSLGKPDDDNETNKLANSGKIDIKKDFSGEIAETVVNGIKNRWIRCRALTELTAASSKSLPEITAMKINIKTGSKEEAGIYAIEPEMAFHNSNPIDVGIKTVRLKGIDVGEMWLRMVYPLNGQNITVIGKSYGNKLQENDLLIFEDGSEWRIEEQINEAIVFCVVIPDGEEYSPDKISLIDKNGISKEASDFYPAPLTGKMIITAILDKPKDLNAFKEIAFKNNGNTVTFSIENLTDKSYLCRLSNNDTIDVSKFNSGTPISLCTAARSGSIAPADIYISTKNLDELPESRLLYFDFPNVNKMPEEVYNYTVKNLDINKGWVNVKLNKKFDGARDFKERKDGDDAYLIPLIKPFGELPNPGDMFYLACDEAFSKRKASIAISFNFSLSGPDINTNPPEDENTFEEERNNKKVKIVIKKKIIFDMSYDGDVHGTVIMVWEYWNGDTKTWRRLNVIDTTGNFTPEQLDKKQVEKNGNIRFTCPEDFAKVKVNGEEKYWIRARMLEGHFGKKEYKSTHSSIITTTITDKTTTEYSHESEPVITTVHLFPVIKYITINYETEPEFPVSCLCLNNAVYLDVTGRIIQGNNPFMPFQESPEKRDTLLFGFDKQLTGGPLRMYFHLQKEFPDLVKAKTAWFYWNGESWNELTVDDTTAGFRMNGYITFFGSMDFARSTMFDLSRFWLKVMISGGSFPDDLIFDGVYFNAVEAVQSNLINDEQLGASNGTMDQSFITVHSPLIDIDICVREPSRPDDESMRKIEEEEPELSLTEVTDDGPWKGEFWIHWHKVEDFDNTESDDRHYRVDRRTGTIYFGSGKKGMIPPRGVANIKCSYRYGGGVAGNVEPGAISSVKSSIPYLKDVTNPFKGDGGAEAETRNVALERGAQCLQHRNRAVTAEDFERFTLLSRAVARVKCLTNIDDEGETNPGWISILIIPATKERPPRAGLQLISNVTNDLQKVCVGTIGKEERLSVRSPQFITIRVEATLIPKVDDAAAGIVNDALQALNKFFDPVNGGLNERGWDFGGTVYRSAVIALLEKVKNVDYTMECLIFADDKYYAGDITIPFDAVTVAGPHSIDLKSSGSMSKSSGEHFETECECA